MVPKRIHVRMLPVAEPAQHDTAQRVRGFFVKALSDLPIAPPADRSQTELVYRLGGNIIAWYFAVLKKYADFSGRARRREYWMFVCASLELA